MRKKAELLKIFRENPNLSEISNLGTEEFDKLKKEQLKKLDEVKKNMKKYEKRYKELSEIKEEIDSITKEENDLKKEIENKKFESDIKKIESKSKISKLMLELTQLKKRQEDISSLFLE